MRFHPSIHLLNFSMWNESGILWWFPLKTPRRQPPCPLSSVWILQRSNLVHFVATSLSSERDHKQCVISTMQTRLASECDHKQCNKKTTKEFNRNQYNTTQCSKICNTHKYRKNYVSYSKIFMKLIKLLACLTKLLNLCMAQNPKWSTGLLELGFILK